MTQWLIPCSYHRRGYVQLEGGNFFSDIQQMAPLVIREEMRERHLVGIYRDPIPTCKSFVGSVVVLFLAFFRVY